MTWVAWSNVDTVAASASVDWSWEVSTLHGGGLSGSLAMGHLGLQRWKGGHWVTPETVKVRELPVGTSQVLQ